MLTYRTAEQERLDKAAIERLLGALDGVAAALRRDDCGAWQIRGRFGHIYAMGPDAAENGWLLVVMNEDGTARQWTADKQRLGSYAVTQDGDTEGCFHLARLPDAGEARAIRTVLGIWQRKRYTQDVQAARVACGRELSRARRDGGFARQDGQVAAAEGDVPSGPQ